MKHIGFKHQRESKQNSDKKLYDIVCQSWNNCNPNSNPISQMTPERQRCPDVSFINRSKECRSTV